MDAAPLLSSGIEAKVQPAGFPRQSLDHLSAPERRLDRLKPGSAWIGVDGKLGREREPGGLALEMDPEKRAGRPGEGDGEGMAREGNDSAHFAADEARDLRDPAHGLRPPRRARLFSASTYPGWIWIARR